MFTLILEVCKYLKLPTKIIIGASLIVTGICLFAPDYFLQALALTELIEKWRSSIGMIFLIALGLTAMYLCTYIVFLFRYIIKKIFSRISIINKLNSLSEEDCRYVIKCYDSDEYLKIKNLDSLIAFDEKWKEILTVPTGSSIQLYAPYKITTKKWIVKRVKKRISKFH